MCLRNLLRRRFRTSLCIFGVSLATIFIVAIGATTTNYTNVIREMNIFFSEEIVVVAEGSMVVQAFPVVGGNIPESTVEKVSKVEGVKTAVPMMVRFGYQVKDVIQLVPTNVSIGVPVGNWSVLVDQTPLKPDGEWPSADLVNKEVVVGPSLAIEMDLAPGSKIKVENVNLTVSGILDTRSALLSRSMILPLQLAQELFYGHTMWVNMIVIEPEESEAQNLVANKIEEEIPGLKALATHERNEIVEPLLSDIETWNLGLSSALYLLSMILVMMVAMINISERRRDFATLDAIGAPKTSVLRMVVTETSLIGLLGGLVGILLGSMAAILIASIYTSIPLSLFFVDLLAFTPPLFMTRILASTVAVSSVAGIVAALAAFRINIAETLRSDY
ncbi:MAG: ABC transporter permease [Candidatus Bathyarchaeota archaeon]|nr:ABC transporter permease [Candidatus Bathyarchaeota archaeon]